MAFPRLGSFVAENRIFAGVFASASAGLDGDVGTALVAAVLIGSGACARLLPTKAPESATQQRRTAMIRLIDVTNLGVTNLGRLVAHNIAKL